jgi:hypothetical protein
LSFSGSVRVRAAPCDLDGDRRGRGCVGPHRAATGAARRTARANCFGARGMSGQGPRGAGWTRRGKELGRAVAGPTRGVSRPSARSRPSRRRWARRTTIRARAEKHTATQLTSAGSGCLCKVRGAPQPPEVAFSQLRLLRPALPTLAWRRSGAEAQGRRPALDHDWLIRALLIMAQPGAMNGGTPTNAWRRARPQAGRPSAGQPRRRQL